MTHWFRAPPRRGFSFGALRGFRLLHRHRLARDRGAAHVARLALVEAAHPVHRLAVVPDYEIVLPPAMGVDKLALRRVLGEIAQEIARFRHQPADNGAGMRGEIERLAPG